MSTEFSLAEAGKLVSPWRFDRWTSLRRIIEKKSPLPLKRQRFVDDAAEQIFERHRAELLERYDIDPRSLQPGDPDTRIGRDLHAVSYVEREEVVGRYVRAEAVAQATLPLICRCQKACKRLADRVARQIVERMKQDGARVTATNQNGDRRELSRAELRESTFHFELAVIEIGGRPWGFVAIDLPVMPLAQRFASPGETPDRRAATMEQAMASWFRTPEGQCYRRDTNARLQRAFRLAHPEYKDRKVTKTTIAKARKAVGWAGRRPTSKGQP